MRRNLLHNILLLGLLLVSLTGMARTGNARRATIGAAGTGASHFSDDTDHHGEIEISVNHTLTGSAHRSHVKNGPGPSALASHNTFAFPVAGTFTLCNLTDRGRSGHLVLIFPSHYFW